MEKNKSDIKAVAVNQSFLWKEWWGGGEREQNDNFHGWGDCESSRWEEERRPDHVTSPLSSFICAARRIFFCLATCVCRVLQTVLGFRWLCRWFVYTEQAGLTYKAVAMTKNKPGEAHLTFWHPPLPCLRPLVQSTDHRDWWIINISRQTERTHMPHVRPL